MTWHTSNRRQRLPHNWPALRTAVLARDKRRCKIQGPRCIGTATEADHITAGDDHHLSNLQAACKPCHAAKSSREGVAARRTPRRKAQRHPGLL